MNKLPSDTNSALLDSTGELPSLPPVAAPLPIPLQPLGLPQRRLNAYFYKNAIEPRQLIDAFLAHSSPETCALELSSSRLPGYVEQSDLLGYVLAQNCGYWAGLQSIYKHRYLRKRALVVGTTATEYLVSPAVENIPVLILELKLQMQKRNSDLLVLKDIPHESPFLAREERTQTEKLKQFCEQSDEFTLIDGKTLAYVEIDFANLDQYYASLDAASSAKLQQKAKSKASVEVTQLFTGDRFFYDPSVLQELYQLYSNTYDQMQFDTVYRSSNALFAGAKQTPNYFHELLLDESNCGLVFLYRFQNQLIGFNLCFVHRQNLIEKYSGYSQPMADRFNLAEVSLLTNLDYACKNDLKFYIAASRVRPFYSIPGAKFTHTKHAVLVANSFVGKLMRSIATTPKPAQLQVTKV